MDIGDPIEQNEHGHVRHAAAAMVETQVHCHGHCPHRAALQIQDGQIGSTLLDRRGDISTVYTNDERCFWGPECGPNFIEHPLRVGRDQDMHAQMLA